MKYTIRLCTCDWLVCILFLLISLFFIFPSIYVLSLSNDHLIITSSRGHHAHTSLSIRVIKYHIVMSNFYFIINLKNYPKVT